MTYQPGEGTSSGDARGAAVAARLAELGVEPADGDIVIPRDVVRSDWGGACDQLAAAIDDLLDLSAAAKDPATAAAFAQAAFALYVPYELQCVLVPKPADVIGGDVLSNGES